MLLLLIITFVIGILIYKYKDVFGYFTGIDLWKIILLNGVLSLVAATPLLIGIACYVGIFQRINLEESIIGILIILAVIVSFIVGNYLLWRCSKPKDRTIIWGKAMINLMSTIGISVVLIILAYF